MVNEVQEKHWSWVIAFACCFINCLLYGVSRLSGLMMVATVEAFNVTRAKAALPYSISTSVRNLSGIFVGYLGQKFGLRPVICAGCILAALGSACCFFISDIFWINICWGGIFGIGFGLATSLLPLAINQNFGRHRGTASGISYSGSYIGSFAFPPLVVQLLDIYGLSGTFLVISGTMLNGLAAAMLFRSPPRDVSNHTNISGPQSIQHHSSMGSKNHFRNFLRKLFHHVKMPKTMKVTELPESHTLPNIYLIAYEPRCDCDVDKRYHPLHIGTEISSAANAARRKSPGCINQTDIISSSLLRFSRSIDKNSILKISTAKNGSRPEYRIKLAKVWEIILLHLFKKRYAFEDNMRFSSPSDDNVKLSSYRYLEYGITSSECSASVHSYSCLHNTNHNFLKIQDFPYVSHISNTEGESKMKLKVPLCDVERNVDGVAQTKVIHLDTISNIPSLHYDYKLSQHNYEVSDGLISPTDICKVSYVPSDHSLSSNQATNGAFNCSHSIDKRLPSKNCSSNVKSSLFKDIVKCCFGWCQMYSDPMFVVITVTMSLHTFVIVCMVTIIEDFAKDLDASCNRVHHVIMALSTADLVGALSLGMITDRGLMSREIFIVLCLFGTGALAIAISFSQSLAMLLVLVAIYGLFEIGVIITFPLLIAQFIREKKQPVALACSNVLSCPTVLFVPPVIGYFRDNLGSYSGVFYVLGITSFVSSFIWLVSPYMVKRYRKKCQPAAQMSTC